MVRLTHLDIFALRESIRIRGESSDGNVLFSRRQVLQLAGVAGAGISPALDAFDRMGERIGVSGDHTRVAFHLGGRERWVIDTGRFEGSPVLTIEKREGFARVVLTHARYPGTNIPADLVAELHHGVLGLRITVRMVFGSFNADMAAESFLAGKSPMRSAVTLHGDTHTLGLGYGVTSGGSAIAEFGPDWTLRLQGPHIATLNTPQGQYQSGTIAIALLDSRQPSVFKRVPRRRTLISLQRGGETWNLDSLLDPRVRRRGTQRGGILAGQFDTLHLEASEKRTALIANVTGNATAMTFTPAGRLQNEVGKPFSYRLAQPRYVRMFATNSDEWVFLARFDTAWMRAGAIALEIDGGPHAGSFELVGKGRSRYLTTAPTISRMSTPVSGALTEPVPMKPGTQLEVHHTHVLPRREKGVVHLQSRPMGRGVHTLYADNLTVSIVRPHDFLVMTLEYTNMALQTDGTNGPILVPSGPNPTMVAHFPPQSMGEQAYLQKTPPSSSEKPTGNGYVQSRLAGSSRLAFSIPASVTQIPYTVESVLNWAGFTQIVPATATRPGVPSPVPAYAPLDGETSIEAPYGLFLSPNDSAGWAHATSEVTNGGITELWHTRMGVQDGAGLHERGHEDLRTMRAVWTPSYVPEGSSPKVPPHFGLPGNADPFRMSLDSNYRDQIVRLTTETGIPGYTPPAANVDTLMLSSMGAWLDLHAAWPELDSTTIRELTLASWRHKMSMGRDTYVRVVSRGNLFPLGHQAAFVVVTERKPFVYDHYSMDPITPVDMILEQQMFVVVLQPDRTYDPGDYPSEAIWPAGHAGRGTPFHHIRIATLATPDLNDPNLAGGGGITVSYPDSGTRPLGQDGFWPTAGSTSVPFHIIAEDREGEPVEFHMPLLFLSSSVGRPTGSAAPHDLSNINTLRGALNVYSSDARRVASLQGQKVSIAPKSTTPLDPAKPVHPGLEMDTMELSADIVDVGIETPGRVAHFYPTMARAAVRVPALKGLLGTASTNSIKYNSAYLGAGLGVGHMPIHQNASANKGQLFADFEDPKPQLKFGPGGGGQPVTPGVATPSTNLQGISGLFGSVGSKVDSLAAGKFDPHEVFGDALLKTMVLGVIPLADLIPGLNDITSGDGLSKIPQLVSHQLPDALETNYTWTTPLGDALILHANYPPPGGDGAPASGTMSLSALARIPVPKGGSLEPPTYKIVGTLSNFYLDFGVMALPFRSITFTIEAGKKMSVVPDVGAVVFEGFLSFINELRKFMAGFTDPPFLNVESDHIEAGFTLAIPDIGVGVFSLQNINLGASLTLPFFGDPMYIAFNFSRREDPFLLTVYIFGGGGFFRLTIDPNGVKTLELSIEAGASFSLNLAVASGSVRAMLGIYMKWEVQAKTGSITGFVDVHGSVSVLGLITATIDVYIGLTYDFSTGKVTGEASVRVEIDLAFFSKSVTIGPIRKEFGGSGSSAHAPIHGKKSLASSAVRVTEVLTKSDWTTYCQAFV